jgi:hypothetical protein
MLFTVFRMQMTVEHGFMRAGGSAMAERGCLSRSTLDRSKTFGISSALRQSGLLRVGHPRSVPFRLQALKLRSLVG